MPRASILLPVLAVLAAAGCGSSDAVVLPGRDGPEKTIVQATRAPLQASNGPLAGPTPPEPLAVALDDLDDPVIDSFGRPPRSGLLFDLDTGEVLWRRDPLRRLPIASVTKMMTALIVAREVPEGTRVRISARARNRPGSRIGLLPKKRRVGVSALLNGLLVLSGNDAAVALAEHVDADVETFVERMNRTAAEMHLGCTQFASPDGLDDRGRSCAYDLAALARAVLDEPRLARIVARRKAALPFPTKGGRLFLYARNPLMRSGYAGVLGIKTGFTDVAGRCFVGAVQRGGRRLGVILLDSPDLGRQARHLLDRGFRLR